MIVDIIDYFKDKASNKVKMLAYGVITVSLLINVIFGISLYNSMINNESLATSVRVAIADFTEMSEENSILNDAINELTDELNTTVTHIVQLNRERKQQEQALESLAYFSEEEVEMLYEELQRREQEIIDREQPLNKLIEDLEYALETYKN